MSDRGATVALVGNPNCGKTTLFNALTGSRQYTGNWPGVTVERKEGTLALADGAGRLVDLPGVYSLTPFSQEELVTRDYVFGGEPDVILNVVDATNLERNLLLTSELLDTGRPVVVALNLSDELKAAGISLDLPRLSEALGVPVVPISALRGDGLPALRQALAHGALRPPRRAAAGGKTAEERHRAITRLLSAVEHRRKASRCFTDRADRFLTDRRVAVPFFFLVMSAVFYMTFGMPGRLLTDFVRWFCEFPLAVAARDLLGAAGASAPVRSLVADGILPGVCGVLVFLPQIMLLFTCLSFLEECGYMARVAFAADVLLRPVGLSGKAFIPIVLGFGCSVPAILSARALERDSDRRILICAVPFISCSARAPVFALLASVFFREGGALFTALIYLLGVAAALAAAALLRRTVFRAPPPVFLMELPPLRRPSLFSVLCSAWGKVRGFLIKAGTVIFAASVLIWCALYFTPRFAAASSPDESLLAAAGRALAPLLTPLGFGDWRAAAALLAGVSAKESILSVFGILSAGLPLSELLSGLFSPAAALSFAIFVLLYLPCAAAIATIRRELSSLPQTAAALLFHLLTAYLLSFLVYQTACLLI